MQSKINIQAYIVILPNKLQKNEGVFNCVINLAYNIYNNVWALTLS